MWKWCVGVGLLAFSLQAFESLPLQIGLWPPVQVVCPDSTVQGLKLNLPYADNEIVQGLDLGVVSGAECFDGIQVNLVNWVRDLATGIQVGAANTSGALDGLSIGVVNRVQTRFTGMQIGVLNYAEDAAGMQIGVINGAETMVGIQIGLVNVIRAAWVPCLPIINWEF
jgi:hypothetical protein